MTACSSENHSFCADMAHMQAERGQTGGHTRPMKVLLYADFRTSHALGWLAGLRRSGLDVRAVSSELLAFTSEIKQASDPVAKLRRALVHRGINSRVRAYAHRLPRDEEGFDTAKTSAMDLLQMLETGLMPLRLPAQLSQLRSHTGAFTPDLVHALRVPYEGLTALTAIRQIPVVVSSWGQDFTMQADRDPLLHRWINRSLRRASGLHVDTSSDVAHALNYGFDGHRPILHAAGNFGVDRGLFYPEQSSSVVHVVYPRGRRRYVNHSVFLNLAAAFAGDPHTKFTGVGLAGDPQAEQLAGTLGGSKLTLTPDLDRPDFAQILRTASVVTSPSTSDGTPNSLLEALACGAYIMAGSVPSVENLLDPVADATTLNPTDAAGWRLELHRVIDNLLYVHARAHNPMAIGNEYDIKANTSRVPAFYREVLRSWAARAADLPTTRDR